MSNILNKLLSCVTCALMVVIICVSVIIGGCNEMLELANGSSVYMKCHWTFVAAAYIAAIGFVGGLLMFFAKETSTRRTLCVMMLAVCASLACIQISGVGIGVCASANMQCHATSIVVWVALVITAAISVFLLFARSKDTNHLPKKSL